jgi:peroxiredoxin/DNA-binding transcriptional MerR regulator
MTMRIGELAARAGVTRKTVRYYESLGLLRPARSGNGYRDYGEFDLRVVAEVRSLNRLGIPIERTRPFLECLATGRGHSDDCPASLAAYRTAIAELTERIGALTAKRDALLGQLRQAARRGGSGETGPPDPADLYTLPPDLPVPADDGAADHLVGRPAPAVVLPSTSGDDVALDRLGAGRTVLYVYPLTGRPEVDLPEGWDTIPGARGCTTQACDFRDHHAELLESGARAVFGLSSQDTDYQRELVARLRLPFAMLADPGFTVARALRLPTFAAGGLTLYRRLTLVIHAGAIEHVFYPVFPPNRHAQQLLTWLRTHPQPW